MDRTSPTPPTMGGFVRGHPPVRRNGRRTLLILVGLCLLGLVVFSQLGENGILSWFDLRAQVDGLEQEVGALEARNAELQEDITSLQEDPATLERIAREQQNMHAPGEEVLLILPPPQAADQGGD